MSTLGIKSLERSCKVYLGASLFCFIFGQIYLYASYGMTSWHMQWMFLLPFLLGFLPMFVLFRMGSSYITRIAFCLWNSAVAVFTFGFLVQGIVDLSGRFTDYTVYYWWIGGAFFVAAIVMLLITCFTHKTPH